jgi:hypothetical protein
MSLLLVLTLLQADTQELPSWRFGSSSIVHPMPYKQNQDGTDDCGHQSTNEAKNLDIQKTGKHPAHKGPGYADQDIGENAMIGFGHLFCNPSGDYSDQQHRKEAHLWVTEKSLRIFHCTLQKPASFASLGAEQAVKYSLNIIEMLFFDVAASFEVITEHRRACTAHHAQLLAQIRQVFYLRRLSLSPLGHLGGAAHRSAKDIA